MAMRALLYCMALVGLAGCAEPAAVQPLVYSGAACPAGWRQVSIAAGGVVWRGCWTVGERVEPMSRWM